MQMTMGREESPKNVRTHIVNKGQEQGAVGEWAWRGGALRNRICAQQYTRTHTCVCAYTYSCGAHDRIPLGQNTYAKCIINHTYIHTNWQRRGRKGSGSQRVAATKGVERSGEPGVVGGRNVTAVYTASRALRPRFVRIPPLLAILPSCHPATPSTLPSPAGHGRQGIEYFDFPKYPLRKYHIPIFSTVGKKAKYPCIQKY